MASLLPQPPIHPYMYFSVVCQFLTFLYWAGEWLFGDSLLILHLHRGKWIWRHGRSLAGAGNCNGRHAIFHIGDFVYALLGNPETFLGIASTHSLTHSLKSASWMRHLGCLGHPGRGCGW